MNCHRCGTGLDSTMARPAQLDDIDSLQDTLESARVTLVEMQK